MYLVRPLQLMSKSTFLASRYAKNCLTVPRSPFRQERRKFSSISSTDVDGTAACADMFCSYTNRLTLSNALAFGRYKLHRKRSTKDGRMCLFFHTHIQLVSYAYSRPDCTIVFTLLYYSLSVSIAQIQANCAQETFEVRSSELRFVAISVACDSSLRDALLVLASIYELFVQFDCNTHNLNLCHFQYLLSIFR